MPPSSEPPGREPPRTDLPVEDAVAELRAALIDRGRAVLQAPPGAGKTTIVPLRLLHEPWLRDQRIVMLEPRRIATRAAAQRMAALLGEEVGGTVGYRTRDEQRVGPATRIEVVTEGILTRRLQADPSLAGTGLVIFDEVHERNLHGDLALALLLDAQPVLRPDLRILAMSATIDAERFAALLGDDIDPVPTVRSDGRLHPVDVRWRPPAPSASVVDAVVDAVHEVLRTERGDVLAFLPGAATIHRAATRLRGSVPDDVDIRPLFGAQSSAEQDLALAPSPTGRRRVVLATDLAESSLTVDGVRVVVDGGEVRTPRHDPRRGMTQLRTGPASQASADQRAGRAGRTEPGVAVRCWSAAEHARRAPHPTPELATADLAALRLEAAVWGSPLETLRFIDAPPPSAVADATALLTELGALDDTGRATAAGRAMAALPVHPRLAAMVLAAVADGNGPVGCVLAAQLDERDVLRGRPDELPVDVAVRVQLVADPQAHHPAVDRGAVRGVRRRADELARRVRLGRGAVADAVDQLDAIGAVLVHAYPDRVAIARDEGRFRLRNGVGGRLPDGDGLLGEELLVVAALAPAADAHRGGAEHRIELAAGLDRAQLEAELAEAIEEVDELHWDDERDDLRQRHERRLGAIVLTTAEAPASPSMATAAALVQRVHAVGLDRLGWSPAARALQARVAAARRMLGDSWPDVSDGALVGSIDEWLAPRLLRATGRRDLERVAMAQVLRTLVGAHRVVELDRLVPTEWQLPTSRAVAIEWSSAAPTVSVRVQDVFGTTVHPTVCDGRLPLTFALLSPAGRPLQITADLPGFWAGSWQDVRKEMAGRYPKHRWPLDPSTEAPGRRRSP